MLCLALLFFAALAFVPTTASAQTKSLKLYYLHTGEKDTITFKRNGKFDQAGLKKINWFLRDWRRNEPTKIDPNLLDLVWEAYRQSGSKDYIHVISGYRSPASNELLRSRGRGVAKNSQHTYGKALDFYLPDVKLAKLREIGLKMEVGGVGFYPTSGSPFVHLDTGSVRHWPKMSRTELAKVFPDGKTMHIPTDGKPLAKYEQAVAAYKKRAAKGGLVPEGKTTASELTFFQRLAGMTKADEADDEENNTAPAPRPVTTTTPAVATAVVEPQYAALPNRVPVPLVAPRGDVLETGTQIAIASLPVEESPVAEETGTESAIDAIAAVSDEADQTVFASIALPVPERRPELQIAALETAPQSSSELAMVDPVAPEPDRGSTRISALTPGEIEDLRRQLASSITSEPAPTPVPVAEVAQAPALVKTGEQAPESVASDLVVASLAPAEMSPVQQETPIVPVPLPNPALEETAKQEPEALVLQPIEPGVKSTGTVPMPEPNPVAPTLVADVQTPQIRPALEAPVMAGLPVPVRNPRTDIVLASLTTRQETPTVQEPALPRRTISLDAFSAPEQNSSTIGQWALAGDHTILDLAEVQAPAYGRNVIRNVDATIIKQGFETQAPGFARNSFTGKAVTAMKFAKLQIR